MAGHPIIDHLGHLEMEKWNDFQFKKGISLMFLNLSYVNTTHLKYQVRTGLEMETD